ncbi:radical SAM protein, partial [Candidatus Magnetomorum sp. HK-1]
MYPKTISIEVTNNCNNQCLICPHGYNLFNKKGYMTKKLYLKILDDIDFLRNKINIELHGIGEPLLHAEIYDFVKIAVKKGFHTTICTNAVLLNKKTAKKIANSGINKIVVSLETKKNYEKIRCINIYDYVLENVMFVADKFSSIDLEIYMISINDKKTEDFDTFKKQFKGKNITFNQFSASNWCGKVPFKGLASKAGKYIKKSVCPLFKHYCSIDYEGLMRHCYVDFNSEYIYGDLNINKFEKIWRSDKRKNIAFKMSSG